MLGRLLERGLYDELKGTAYAIIEGIDGRTHHLRFTDIEVTGDAPPGAIVELRAWDDANGRKRLSLATRSDLSLEAQMTAPRRNLARSAAHCPGARAGRGRIRR